MTNHMALSFKHRVLKAGGWATGSFVANQAIRLGGNLIFTRLLFPEAFGLMAIIYVLITALALISDLGIGQGIIRNPRGGEADYLNTAWTIQILRGFFISIIMLCVALMLPFTSSLGWWAKGSVYTNPVLPWLIAVFSVTPILQGFESTKISEARRNLELGKVTKIELLSQCVAMFVMIGFAWIYRSVWVLVAGAIVSGLVRCVSSHIWLHGTHNRFCLKPDFAKDILHFGIKITMLSFIGFLSTNGDRLILGNLVDSATLGIYSIAFLLTNTLFSFFSSLIASIALPAFSEVLRHRKEDAAKVYFHMQGVADMFLICATVFLIVAGNVIVSHLYDSRYAAAGHMLKILAFGLIGCRYGIVDQYCMAKGILRQQGIGNLCRSIALCAGLPLGYSFAGMDGALFMIVLSQFAGWPVAMYYKAKLGLWDVKRSVPTFAGFLLVLGLLYLLEKHA